MKRISILGLFLMVQMYINSAMSQSLNESEISHKMELISDSLENYQSKRDYHTVKSICENGIAFLSNKELFYTPASCSLCLEAGKASMSIKDYISAKFYLYKSFVLDELGDFGIESYSQIIKLYEDDSNLHYFKELLDLAKSDSAYLNKLALEPSEFGYQLNTIAWNCFNKGEYSSAIDFFEMEINLLDALGETGNDNYLSIIPCVISCLNELGNFELAISHADYNLSLIKTFKGENTIAYARGLQIKANLYFNFDKASESVRLYEEALSLFEKLSGKYNMDYIRCMDGASLAYQNYTGSHTKKLEMQLEMADIMQNVKEATPSDQAHVFNNLSHSYSVIGDKLKCIEFAEKQVNILEKYGKTDDSNYATSLSTLCAAYSANNSYNKAIEIGEKAVDIFSRLDLYNSQKILYRQTVSNLSYAYFVSGNTTQAISLLNTILSPDIPADKQKLSDLQRLSTFYQRLGKVDLMKSTIENSLMLAEAICGKQSDEYANALLYAAGIQEKNGDGLMLLQQAADIYKDLYGVDSDEYKEIQRVMSFMSTKTITTVTSQIDLDRLKTKYGENSTKYFNEYINYLYTLGNKYKESKDIANLYKTSLELDSLSKVIYSTFSKKEECFIWARHTLAELIIDMYDMCLDIDVYNSCINIQKEVVSASLSLYGENNIKYVREVEQLAQIMNHFHDVYFYLHKDELDKIFELNEHGESGFNFSESWKYYKSTSLHKCFDEVTKYQQIAIDYYKNSYGMDNHNNAHACKKMADYYANEISVFPLSDMIFSFSDTSDFAFKELNDYKDKAEHYYTLALDYYKNRGDFDKAASVLHSLHFLYESVKDDTKSVPSLIEGFALWKDETIKQLSMMTSEEKSQHVSDNYWESQIGHYNSTAYYKSLNPSYDSRYADLAYDVQLLNKGLLLKSEIGLRELIIESGNTELISNFEKLVTIQKQISDSEDETSIRLLKDECNKLERHLLKESELYGNYLQNFSYSFQDVRASLRDKDAAIEFSIVRMPVRDENDNFIWKNSYYALVLKKNYSSPKVIHLEKNISIDSLYHSVWEPLMNEIKDMENVFFSPAYDLNNLPLESAQLPDGSYLSDMGINFYRVSSTREIINSHSRKKYDSMVLYGGLQYNADVKDMIESDAEERTRGMQEPYSLGEDIKNDLRSGAFLWKYLPGTLAEISDIGKIALNKGIKSKSYSSSKGTESSFKNLSKKGISILHIATHGFYIPSLNAISEESMKRSGLAFAGANNTARGVSLPDNMDDGILTADEISKLDFRNVNLVVLSACDTGLGKITGEGVYGLQRGFKKAGAESLMMSLWPVDDQATCMLMTEFYKQLFAGKTTSEALKHAQKVVRNTVGFESPEYWAGFILLDGNN